MNHRLFYILMLFFSIILSKGYGQVTVVVADFENNSGGFDLDYWEKAIPEFLISELSKSDRIIIVERNKLDNILNEQALALTGILDSSDIKQVGKLLNAQFIIQGTINKNNGKTRIDASIVKVKSGEVKNEKAIAPDDGHLEEMIELLSNNIIKVLVGQGNYVDKIQLAEMPTTYFAVATGGLLLTTVLLNNSYLDSYNAYKDATTLSEFNSKYDKANNLNKFKIVAASAAGLALAGTIYCWIKNNSANEILALDSHETRILPVMLVDAENNLKAGITIAF